MGKFLMGFLSGMVSIFAMGWLLCEIAEHCDLPLEIPEDNT